MVYARVWREDRDVEKYGITFKCLKLNCHQIATVRFHLFYTTLDLSYTGISVTQDSYVRILLYQ